MIELGVDDAEGIRTITINRPRVKNALTLAMRQRFCMLVDQADRDPTVKAIIVTGVDPVFSAGVDFKEHDPSFDPRQRQFTVNPGRALRAIRKPTVCAVNGACVSGALEIALSASFIVASTRARFADTHARLGVVPAWGLTALLPRAIGVRKAREMALTGHFVGADEALRIGLVNHVVAHEDLLPFARGLVRAFADTPAAAQVLSLYDDGQDVGLNASLALETRRVAAGPEWDAEAFADAGRATAARQRTP